MDVMRTPELGDPLALGVPTQVHAIKDEHSTVLHNTTIHYTAHMITHNHNHTITHTQTNTKTRHTHTNTHTHEKHLVIYIDRHVHVACSNAHSLMITQMARTVMTRMAIITIMTITTMMSLMAMLIMILALFMLLIRMEMVGVEGGGVVRDRFR